MLETKQGIQWRKCGDKWPQSTGKLKKANVREGRQGRFLGTFFVFIYCEKMREETSKKCSQFPIFVQVVRCQPPACWHRIQSGPEELADLMVPVYNRKSPGRKRGHAEYGINSGDPSRDGVILNPKVSRDRFCSGTFSKGRALRKAVRAIVCAAAIGLLFVAGCSDEAANDSSTSKVGAVATVSTIRDGTEVQADILEPEDLDAVPSEAASTVAQAGVTESQTAGETIDGLKLADIRWGDHGDYLRIVFDLTNTSDGQVLQAPYAETVMSAEQDEVTVTLGGIRGIGANPTLLAEEIDIGDSMVLSLQPVPSYDDQALVYKIKLAGPATYSLASLGDPGRVIVDIYK